MRAVTVLDYGIGNLLNVVRALQKCGAQVNVIERNGQGPISGHVVMPGVGAFKDAMREIEQRGFGELIAAHAAAERPFLGICVGMQVMFSVGEEFGHTPGLGLIAGRVAQIAAVGATGVQHRIPLVGWRPLSAGVTGLGGVGAGAEPLTGQVPGRWQGTILEAAKPGEHAYFVHSFAGVVDHSEDALASINYNGLSICAAVQRGSATGCQFHPEKSGEVGLGVLRQFLVR